MSGTTFTWIGGIGNTDFLWTTASNWLVSGGVQAAPPNSPTAIVIVDSEPVDTDIINGASITVGSLSIGGIGPSAGQLLVAGSKTVVGDIFTGGGGTLESVGPIVVTSTDVNGGLVGGPGGIVKAPSMTIGVGAAIGGGGTYDVTTIVNNGLILADGGRPDMVLGPVVLKGGTISGTGNLEVAGPSTLEPDAATAQNIVVDAGSTATIKLDSPTTFKGGIALGAGSRLNLFLNGLAPTRA